MDKLDEYESVFRSSAKERFQYAGIPLGKVLLVTDRDPEAAAALAEKVEAFLEEIHKGDAMEFTVYSGEDYAGLQDLIEKAEAFGADLVVTHRGLRETEKKPPFSLGVYLDVLTQVTKFPILVLPDDDDPAFDKAMDHLREVVVVTDHLQGDSQIINWGARFVPRNGKLVLAHVEDDAVFERYMGVIGRIPDIPTEDSRRLIMAQLLQEPTEFIESVRKCFAEENVPIEVLSEVRSGHVIADYQQVLDAHEGDLLVMHTKDESQRAMHGQAYAIAVEYRHVALLLV
jgi:hypothetical protein